MLAAGTGSANAKGKTVRAAILPTEVQGVPAKLGIRLQAVISRELKAIGVFKVVPGKSAWKKIKRLIRKKVFKKGCTENPRCVKTVGRNLRVKVLYRLKVTKAEAGVTVSLRALDVKSGKEIRESSESAINDPKDIDRAVRWVSRKVSSPMITTLAKGKGKLQIDCTEEGADLYLNGKSFGKRTGKSFKVSSGVFDIQVKKEGFKTYHDVVVVKVGQKKVVKAKLARTEVTKPVEVAVAPVVKPVEAAPEKKETVPEPVKKKEVKTSDLPAWAVFEKPKPKALQKEKPTEPGKKKKTATLMPWQKPKKKEPYLPDPKKEEPPKVEDDRDDDTAFYQTWWFWTIVGVGVAAGGGTAAYFLLSGDEETASVGTALVRWE
jgi:hypothetical protein